MMPPDYVENQRGEGYSSEETKRAYTELCRNRAKVFCRLAKQVEGVLDAGCREGAALSIFKAHWPYARVIGVDIVPEFVEEAAKVGDAQVADLHALPFESYGFDWTFCSHALEHCHNFPKARDEVYRVTQTGVFWVVPIEGAEAFEASAAHYTYSDDPIEWLNRLNHPEWYLCLAQRTSVSDLIACFLRKEGT
jgi:ubiquinone/menaquinone biosynthesis C-methylase UbiE